MEGMLGVGEVWLAKVHGGLALDEAMISRSDGCSIYAAQRT